MNKLFTTAVLVLAAVGTHAAPSIEETLDKECGADMECRHTWSGFLREIERVDQVLKSEEERLGIDSSSPAPATVRPWVEYPEPQSGSEMYREYMGRDF